METLKQELLFPLLGWLCYQLFRLLGVQERFLEEHVDRTTRAVLSTLGSWQRELVDAIDASAPLPSGLVWSSERLRWKVDGERCILVLESNIQAGPFRIPCSTNELPFPIELSRILDLSEESTRWLGEDIRSEIRARTRRRIIHKLEHAWTTPELVEGS